MWFFVFLGIILFQCAAPPAVAGAWLREKGTGFTATTYTLNRHMDQESKVYLEYGILPDLTLVGELAFLQDRHNQQGGNATLTLRRPIGSDRGSSRLAYELGVKAIWVADQFHAYPQTGLSWGHGFTLKDRNGWLSFESSITWDTQNSNHLAKLDSTVGLAFSDRLSGMMQVYTSHIAGETFASLAPSLLISPGFSDGQIRIQIGTETPLRHHNDTRLKIGLWREF